MKIGAMLRKAMLFHFIQLGCLQIFKLFGDFSPFRPPRVNILFVLRVGNRDKSWSDQVREFVNIIFLTGSGIF
jgi:hypothetical protein